MDFSPTIKTLNPVISSMHWKLRIHGAEFSSKYVGVSRLLKNGDDGKNARNLTKNIT